jgi:hypothetical protein
VSESSAWEARARYNLKTLTQAHNLHSELEKGRQKKEGKGFESEPLKIKLSVPDQELLDSSKELIVVRIDQDSMAIYVLQISGKSDDLISILLGDVMLTGYCNKGLQEKMLLEFKDKVAG